MFLTAANNKNIKGRDQMNKSDISLTQDMKDFCNPPHIYTDGINFKISHVYGPVELILKWLYY